MQGLIASYLPDPLRACPLRELPFSTVETPEYESTYLSGNSIFNSNKQYTSLARDTITQHI